MRTATGGKGSNQYQQKGTSTGGVSRSRAVFGDAVEAATFQLTETTVTTAAVRPVGDLAFVTFPDGDVRLVRAEDAKHAEGLPEPITWLKTRPQWGVLDPNGPDIFHDVAWELVPDARRSDAGFTMRNARDLLADGEVNRLAYQYNAGGMWMYGEPNARNRVYCNASAAGSSVDGDRYDLDTAAAILGEHPWVKAVDRHEVRKAADCLVVQYRLPDDLHDRYWAGITPDTKNPTPSTFTMDRVLFWAQISHDDWRASGVPADAYAASVLPEDPFGLRPALLDRH